MRSLLLHPDTDVELAATSPAGHEAVVEDLGLDDLIAAMSGGDRYLRDVARKVLLTSLTDPAAIRYRQGVLRDCIDQPAMARQLYDLSNAAIESERRAWRIRTDSPELALSMAVRALEALVPMLRQLRTVSDAYRDVVRSDGLRRFFDVLRAELDDEYLGQLDEHRRLLTLPEGVSMNGRLGRRNAGTGFVLLRPPRLGWRRLLRGGSARTYTIVIPDGDDGARETLAELRARGISLVANAASQAVDHVLGFFRMIRFETAFHLACLNLLDRLEALGVPVTFPEPAPSGTTRLTARGLVDVGFALRARMAPVGNDLDADGRSLILITGANRGGKSTFLRGVAIAQLMLQAGMFVGATAFEADVRDNLFTHFRRREDRAMASGKLDEELKRLGELVDHLTPRSILFFNESFAATNEREGADIAEGILAALIESGAKVLFVTHSYELARRFTERDGADILFLRAERLPDGRRTFLIQPGEALPTSHGRDLFRRIFPETSPIAVGSARSTDGQQEGDRGQLGDDGEDDQRREGDVVQHSHHGAADEPRDPEAGGEEAVGRGAPLRGDHAGDGRRNDRLVDAHADAPQDDAKQRRSDATEEHQRGERGADDRERDEDAEAAAVEQMTKHQ